MNFDYQGRQVTVDRFRARIAADAPEEPEAAEMLRNAVRVAIRERMVAEGRDPIDVPVIYAPEIEATF